jgi:serine/threonine-protein kinase
MPTVERSVGDRSGKVLVETYRLVRRIAEGGMGEVYEAQHLRVPKRFAVKFMRVELADKTEALARFRREAEIIATLEHPNIVNLIDYNLSDDGVPYIVLEFLDGQDLAQRLGRARVELDEALRITRAVGSALATAHAHGVVHRDLKPENVFLCRADQIKVVDFGVAKLRGGSDLTAFNSTVGTVPYMSPEQISGGALDGRSDEYALATILYEMLSGAPAFGGSDDLIALAKHVLTHEPPPLEGVPPAVAQAIARAMAKAANARFPSVADFLVALDLAVAAPSATVAAPAELPPLQVEATAITHATAEIDRPFPSEPSSVRVTARGLRRLRPTLRRLREPRVLSIAVGALLGLVFAGLWLLVN